MQITNVTVTCVLVALLQVVYISDVTTTVVPFVSVCICMYAGGGGGGMCGCFAK